MNTEIEKSEENLVVNTAKILYTGKTRTTGGRDGGSARSSDGRLDVKLSVPGSTGSGTNPEHLFAAGWSACFIGAMKIAARKLKIQIPPSPPQRQSSGFGYRNGPGIGGCGPSNVPLFESHARQRKR